MDIANNIFMRLPNMPDAGELARPLGPEADSPVLDRTSGVGNYVVPVYKHKHIPRPPSVATVPYSEYENGALRFPEYMEIKKPSSHGLVTEEFKVVTDKDEFVPVKDEFKPIPIKEEFKESKTVNGYEKKPIAVEKAVTHIGDTRFTVRDNDVISRYPVKTVYARVGNDKNIIVNVDKIKHAPLTERTSVGSVNSMSAAFPDNNNNIVSVNSFGLPVNALGMDEMFIAYYDAYIKKTVARIFDEAQIPEGKQSLTYWSDLFDAMIGNSETEIDFYYINHERFMKNTGSLMVLFNYWLNGYLTGEDDITHWFAMKLVLSVYYKICELSSTTIRFGHNGGMDLAMFYEINGIIKTTDNIDPVPFVLFNIRSDGILDCDSVQCNKISCDKHHATEEELIVMNERRAAMRITKINDKSVNPAELDLKPVATSYNLISKLSEVFKRMDIESGLHVNYTFKFKLYNVLAVCDAVYKSESTTRCIIVQNDKLASTTSIHRQFKNEMTRPSPRVVKSFAISLAFEYYRSVMNSLSCYSCHNINNKDYKAFADCNITMVINRLTRTKNIEGNSQETFQRLSIASCFREVVIKLLEEKRVFTQWSSTTPPEIEAYVRKSIYDKRSGSSSKRYDTPGYYKKK